MSQESDGRFKGHLLQGRRVVFDANAVERLIGPIEGHVIGNERQMTGINHDSVGFEHVHDLGHDRSIGRLDSVIPVWNNRTKVGKMNSDSASKISLIRDYLDFESPHWVPCIASDSPNLGF